MPRRRSLSARDWRVMARAPAVRYGELTVRVRRRARPSDPSRLGVVVRGVSTAVLRNRIRRRVREAFYRTGVRGCDVIVAATQRSATTNFQTLVAQLREALIRAGAVQ
jgi:ribonuclease P protein component